MMLKRLLLLGIGTAFLALALVACGADEDDATPASGDDTGATPVIATPAPNGEPADDDAGLDDAGLDDDADDFEPFAFAEGENIFELAGVNSFRQRWSMTMSGPGAGPEAGTMEVLTELMRDPPAMRARVTDADGSTMFEVIRIGEDAWFGGEGMGWQQMPAGSVPLDPADMMATGALLMPGDEHDAGLFSRVGSEQLNGRQTTRYTLDGTALFQFLQVSDAELADADITEGRIDYWVDESGRFLVKYEMVIEGSGLDAGLDDFGDFDDGFASDEPVRMEMVFELFDFDADLGIEPPE